MDLIILSLESQSYEQLTNLHKIVKENIKSIDKDLEYAKQKKASELTESEIHLLKKHNVLFKLRLEISERLLAFADNVKIQEAI